MLESLLYPGAVAIVFAGSAVAGMYAVLRRAERIREEEEEEREESGTITVEEYIDSHKVYTNGFDAELAHDVDTSIYVDDRVYTDVVDVDQFAEESWRYRQEFSQLVRRELRGFTKRKLRNLERQLRKD